MTSHQEGVEKALERVRMRCAVREAGAMTEALDLVPSGQRQKYVADILADATVTVSFSDLRTILTHLSTLTEGARLDREALAERQKNDNRPRR